LSCQRVFVLSLEVSLAEKDGCFSRLRVATTEGNACHVDLQWDASFLLRIPYSPCSLVDSRLEALGFGESLFFLMVNAGISAAVTPRLSPELRAK